MLKKLKQFAGKTQKALSSSDNMLWLWAVIAAAGLLLFYLLTGVPGKGNTLVFAQWWEDELETGVLEKLVKDFEEEHPGIKVQLEKKSRQEIKAVLSGAEEQVRGKKRRSADIFSVEGGWTDDPGCGLAALDEELFRKKSPYSPWDSLPPGSPGETENRALPVISFINPLFYNIELLRDAGFDRPPKNQTEFLSYVQAITKPEQGIYGAVLALGEENSFGISRHILSWIWSAGIQDGDTFDFGSKQVAESLAFLNQLKPYLYPDFFGTDEEARLDIFIEGKAGMMIGSVSDVKKLREQMKQDFSITTIPGPALYVGKPVFALSSWYAGIGAESEKQEEAAEFIVFLLEHASQLAAGAFAIPGNGSRNPELINADPYYSKAYDMYDAGEMVRELYGTGRTRKLNAVIYEELKRMFEGRSPEDTAAAIQNRWENI
ncbi:MAG: ABC transporter substrate-binding protein [Treponema sp.]|jgi:multiple sugar transport system substrate-binding protein|nr:ABC transporter substrate-binding protein [Treponema sp.]